MLAVLACHAQNSEYVRQESKDSVIVFVHGALGDPRDSWTNADTKAYWPVLMKGDPSFNDFDIYVFGYPSSYARPSYTLDEVVEVMRKDFAMDGVFTRHKKIFFLCHSMGGLVVRAFLNEYQKQAAQVPMIYFFSTPTTGAQIARIAATFSRNRQLGSIHPISENEYLASIQKGWLAARFPIASYCAYETQDTFGIRVVGQESATNLCNRRLDPINANHFDIVKPRDRRDEPYTAFQAALQEVLQEQKEAAASVKTSHPKPPPPPMIRTMSFSTVIPFTVNRFDAGIPYDSNSQDPLSSTYNEIAAISRFPYSPFPPSPGQPQTVQSKIRDPDIVDYLGHVMQYFVLRSIIDMQNPKTSFSYNSGTGTSVNTTSPISVPGAAEYPNEKLRHIFDKLNLQFGMHAGPDDWIWEQKIKAPAGSTIDFVQTAGEGPTKYIVRFQRLPDLLLDVTLESFYKNQGQGSLPKNFVPAAAREIQVAWGYIFTVTVNLQWSGDRLVGEDYAEWAKGLDEGLRSRLEVR
jgi:pimeloyl-ACP methyl ester carboxylesterase